MPDPKPSLAQVLFNRMGGYLPPKPEGPPVDVPGSAPLTLAENPVGWAFERGADFLRGFSGLGDQGPAGPTATGLGQAFGAAMPLVPGGQIKSILKGAKAVSSTVPTLEGATRFIQNVPGKIGSSIGGFLAGSAAKSAFNSISKNPKIYSPKSVYEDYAKELKKNQPLRMPTSLEEIFKTAELAKMKKFKQQRLPYHFLQDNP